MATVALAAQGLLPRSSHSIAWIEDEIYIIGGEVQPRAPASPLLNIFNLKDKVLKSLETEDAPAIRVGAASVVVDGKIYLWGGRGGAAMTPLDERGIFHIYDPKTSKWTQTPVPTGDIPEPRSYHALAAMNDKIYLHGGCPAKGRLNTLHVYSIPENKWTQLSDAPGLPRGGTSLVALNDSVLLRFGGFSGVELGESIEIFDPETNKWTSRPFSHGPGNRSVAILVPHPICPSTKAVLLYGEKSPSSDGHNAAGRFWSDVWVYDYDVDQWEDFPLDGAHLLTEGGLGWSAGAIRHGVEGSEIIVWGGLNDHNERIADAWLISLEH